MKLSGCIQKYLSDRGFGFIVEHKNQHFFHITSCSFIPQVGQLVTFDIGVGKRGPAAVNVELDKPVVDTTALQAMVQPTAVKS